MSKRLRRTNLFTNFYVKDLGYYGTADMKPESLYPEVSKVLEELFNKNQIQVDFPGKVHIFNTNRDYMLAYQNGKIRVTNIQLSMNLTKNPDSKWIKLI